MCISYKPFYRTDRHCSITLCIEFLFKHTHNLTHILFTCRYIYISFLIHLYSFPESSVGKESTCNAGDPGLTPELGRSPGEGKGYPLQCSGLDSSMDCIVHGVTKSWTLLSDFHFSEFIAIKIFCSAKISVNRMGTQAAD